jgi:hypothetical protein
MMENDATPCILATIEARPDEPGAMGMQRQTMLTGKLPAPHERQKETTILIRKDAQFANLIHHHLSHLLVGVSTALARSGGALGTMLGQEFAVFFLVCFGLRGIGNQILDMLLDGSERFRIARMGTLTFKRATSAFS